MARVGQIDIACGTLFAGIDATGAVLLTGARGGLLHPPGVILALGLPAAYLAEGARYRLRRLRAGAPVLTGAVVRGIWSACMTGSRPMTPGLPARRRSRFCAPAIAALLAGRPAPPEPAALVRERRVQALLARLFARDTAAELGALPPDTILCCCEGRKLADLSVLGASPTARELPLTGRLGIGACQGRFCADWVAQISGQRDLGRSRLPVQPLSIANLRALPPPEPGDLP